MNVRIWRHALEPPALKGVSPQIYALRNIGRATIGLAYTSFFHYIKYISHGRLGPCYRCTGAYPTPFSIYSYFGYYLLHFYEHILAHFLISYSLFVILIISITTMRCVYLFVDMCPVILLFVMYYDTVHSFSIFTYQCSI